MTDIVNYLNELEELAQEVRDFPRTAARYSNDDRRLGPVCDFVAKAFEKQNQINSLLLHKIEEIESKLNA